MDDVRGRVHARLAVKAPAKPAVPSPPKRPSVSLSKLSAAARSHPAKAGTPVLPAPPRPQEGRHTPRPSVRLRLAHAKRPRPRAVGASSRDRLHFDGARVEHLPELNSNKQRTPGQETL
ncbi:hypothetical protein GCM10010392_23870 [Streptomyces clavifer]|nr:hypothetical protein GCM10010392_23870 [Streptomyces clavifer]